MLGSGWTRQFYLQCPYEPDAYNMLLCYLALHHLLPFYPRMFTRYVPPSSVDFLCSGRRRRRPASTTIRPPASELARRVEALAVPVDNKV